MSIFTAITALQTVFVVVIVILVVFYMCRRQKRPQNPDAGEYEDVNTISRSAAVAKKAFELQDNTAYATRH